MLRHMTVCAICKRRKARCPSGRNSISFDCLQVIEVFANAHHLINAQVMVTSLTHIEALAIEQALYPRRLLLVKHKNYDPVGARGMVLLEQLQKPLISGCQFHHLHMLQVLHQGQRVSKQVLHQGKKVSKQKKGCKQSH